MRNITFLPANQIFGNKKLEIFEKYGTKAAITDFAILLGGLVSSNEYIGYDFNYLDNSKTIGAGKEKEIELKVFYKKDAPSVLFRSSIYDASNTLEMSLGDNFINIPNTLKNLGIFGIIFGIIAVVIRCVDKKVIKK